MQIVAAALALTMGLAVSAEAATVTLFDDKGGGGNVAQGGDLQRATGTWREEGFNVAWEYIDGYYGYTDVSQIGDDFLDMIDYGCSGCGGGGQKLEITRADGGSFSVKEIDATDITTMVYAIFSYTPFRADGTLDFTNTVENLFEAVYYPFQLNGVKTDGTAVTATEWSRRLFSDLTSFSLTVSPNAEFAENYRHGLKNDLLDPIFRQLPRDCESGCTVAGLGQFGFTFDQLGVSNYATAVGINDITLQVRGGGEPAPVPLPASAALMGLALSALGLAAKRRRTH